MAGATIRPQERNGWYHDFWSGHRPIVANFQDASISAPFTFQPTPFSKDYWNAGGALDTADGGPVSMVADFDYQGDGERKFYNFSIGARLAL